MTFVHLHVHSAYSLLTSTISVEQLVLKAKAKGFHMLALTDRNVMHGTIAFYKECLKHGLKPIIGLTVDVKWQETEQAAPLILLAKNQTGLGNLIKISSVMQTKSPDGIPVKWLKHYAEGLFAISPGRLGAIENQLLQDNLVTAESILHTWMSIFGRDGVYLSIQNGLTKSDESRRDQVLALAGKYNLPYIATNEVYYTDQEDAFAHECILAIRDGHKLQDETRERLETDQFFLKTSAEMIELFTSYPEALENTLRLADACNVMIELGKHKLPQYPTEPGVSSNQLLQDLCEHGLTERFDKVTDEYKARLDFELDVIFSMGFADYFLIVWDFMKYAREHDILTGPGRGSAAGSLVAYCLRITDVDPIQHGLLFERFLNPERITMPDIDIDFPDHRRDEVIQYVAHKYGQMHVAQIVTFGTMAAKAVLRDVGRAFGLNMKELELLSRTIPAQLGITLKDAYIQSERLRAFVSESEVNRRLFDTAAKLEGLPRHTSTHAAGVIIAGEPLVQTVPISSGSGSVYVTQYSMDHLEDIGLLKMDFLGLRNLTLIENILSMIHAKTGLKVDIHKLPLDDVSTFELLGRGETTGVFQLESEGMRSVLKRLKPSRLEDIVAVNALYRPGPMENIPLFINRKHGLEPVVYPHPDLEPILVDTYGIIVYQEQIMKIASVMSGFSLAEADLLRRAVGKKKKEILDKEREHFVNGALAKGYTAEVANEVYDLIVKFANYGFNRSHAVAYSMIAYQLAYLKARFPLYFFAALLSLSLGNETKIAQYIRECKEMNIEILPPSINHSGYSFLVEKQHIRYSLSAIKGIGAQSLKPIFAARKQKKFADLFDFCIRVSPKVVNRKALEALIHSGAFDEFGEDRAVLLATLDVALEHAELVNPDDLDQGDLFSLEEFFLKPKYVEIEPIRLEDKLSFEKEVLGLYLSDHPVSSFRLLRKAAKLMVLADLTTARKQQFVKTIVYLTEVKKIRTKKGEAMAFLTISDESGEIEAVCFPVIYKKNLLELKVGNIVYLEGKTEVRENGVQLIVSQIKSPTELETNVQNKERTLYIKIENQHDKSMLLMLKQFLNQCPGPTPVVLYYEETNKRVLLGKEDQVELRPELLDDLYQLLGKPNVIVR